MPAPCCSPRPTSGGWTPAGERFASGEAVRGYGPRGQRHSVRHGTPSRLPSSDPTPHCVR
jgi:hypothetical protein